jgi:uncharacterized protein YcbK (DUF882 family)
MVPAAARASAPRRLAFLNLHTGESLRVTYAEGGAPDAAALREIDWLLRDHRTGETHEMSLALLNLLDDVQGRLDVSAVFHVISGYRSPATNASLHTASAGVAANSLHMRGMAIDVRVPGVALDDLRNAALVIGRGGVGYYPSSDFVHVDIGRPRSW